MDPMPVLPGGVANPPRTVFLDRDGTILEDRHYLADPEGVVLLPGAASGLRRMQAAGIALVVVSNQSGWARGLISPAELLAVEDRFQVLLVTEGITLTGCFYCLHRAEDGCACRKPRDGMVRHAAAELGLDLQRCMVVGDKPADIGLARGVGATAVLVRTGEGAATLAAGASPDLVVNGLDELADLCGLPADSMRSPPA